MAVASVTPRDYNALYAGSLFCIFLAMFLPPLFPTYQGNLSVGVVLAIFAPIPIWLLVVTLYRSRMNPLSLDRSVPSNDRGLMSNLVLSPVSFGLLAALSEHQSIDHSVRRDLLGCDDSILREHLKVLQKSNLVTVHKWGQGRYAKTSVSVTKEGLRRFNGHLVEVERLSDLIEEAV